MWSRKNIDSCLEQSVLRDKEWCSRSGKPRRGHVCTWRHVLVMEQHMNHWAKLPVVPFCAAPSFYIKQVASPCWFIQLKTSVLEPQNEVSVSAQRIQENAIWFCTTAWQHHQDSLSQCLMHCHHVQPSGGSSLLDWSKVRASIVRHAEKFKEQSSTNRGNLIKHLDPNDLGPR